MCGAPTTVYAFGHILAVLRRSPARTTSHHHHHAVVLTELIYFLNTLLDQELEGRHRVERVQNPDVSYVRYLIGRNEKKFDYINCVGKHLRFWSTRVRGHTLPLLLLCIF